METALTFSIILNIILAPAIYILWTCVNSVARENQEQQQKLRDKDLVISNQRVVYEIEKAKLIVDMKKIVPPSFDNKTIKLLNLAVKNTNDNEARNAAQEACKLIYKKLNG